MPEIITHSMLTRASSLRELNGFLTELMARQKIQSLLKDSDLLERVLDTVRKLSDREGEVGALTAVALLGRLVAVSRGRDEEQRLRAITADLVTDKIPSFEVLADAEEKTYAAQSLLDIQGDWLHAYAMREAVAIDQAENARRVLLEVALRNSPSIGAALGSCASAFAASVVSVGPEPRARRAKRVSTAWVDLLGTVRKSPGTSPGAPLKEFVLSLVPPKKHDVSEEIVGPIVEDVLAILTRMLELRFSLAVDAETYGALATCRIQLGREGWYRFWRQSEHAEQVSVFLNEAALVLARQGRTDSGVIDALLVIHSDRASLTRSLTRHFPSTLELDARTKNWWLKGGIATTQSDDSRNDSINATEDQRIGDALIEIEKIDPTVRYIVSTVRPELQFSNPPAAAALSRVAGSYQLLAQNLRQLARMRRLSVTQLEGNVIEYNPSQHEMLGGHRDGVRQVKVVREGVEKRYPTRQAVLVKPWVEPAKD